MTHADIAIKLVTALPPGVFAHAARDGVIHQDFRALRRMLPGVKFGAMKVGPDEWHLSGTCVDASVAIWTVGA